MRSDVATMFIGVTEGYQASSVLNPEDAQRIISTHISLLKRQHKDGNAYTAYPGLAVYQRELGCPEDREKR